jgi:broad specificity phosphatase PhoE
MNEVWQRMNLAAAQIRVEQPIGSVVIVGHGGSLRVLLCDALDTSITSMKHIFLSNAGMSVVEEIGSADRCMRRVVLMNDTSHLTA